jgi:hypothetical protein
MTDPNVPPFPEVPSSRRLLRSTLIALGVAIVLLATVVLPAEYGIDPTGIGRVLGLTQMGEIKVGLAREAAADAAADAAAAAAEDSASVVATTPAASGPNEHETKITLAPGEGKEVKLVMRRGARATYSWSTDSGVVNYLTHGDTANAPAGQYHTYGRGTSARSDEGTIEAVFDGSHGWFWRNRSSAAVLLTLRTRGDYQELKQPG